MLDKLQNSRNALGLIFMLPAAVLLLLFLTYPLGLGVWLGFTDAKVGRPGQWIGLENYIFLAGDSVTQLALFNTLFYTTVASVLKFFLGLWLALLLNKNLRFKSFFRAVILLPYIVPTALSAIAFWWIFDAQFSIISWALMKMGLIDQYIDFLGEPWNARFSVIAANVWRGVPFVAITLLAGLQTISPSYYEASAIDGATPWQQFRHVTLAAADADHRGGDDLLGAVHLHRLPAHLRHHARRPAERHAPDGHAVLPARHLRRRAGRRRSHLHRHGALPAGRHPVQLLRAAAPRLAARRGRQMSDSKPSAWNSWKRGGASWSWCTCRWLVFLFVLLFPFYWMAITSFKPNNELLSREGNPFWVIEPTLAHVKKLLFDTAYPQWMWNTVLVSVVATFFSLVASVLAAYAIERLRFSGAKQTGLAIFLAYLVPPSILFIPLASVVFQLGLFDTRLALILTYPTFLIPFCTWLLMGYFRTIPFELEECALIDGANRWQILVKIVLPLAVPGLISAGIFAFTLSWNEFIYALTFVSSSEIQDAAGGRGHRTGRRRCLPLGLADGRRAVRLAAGGLRLLVLRRVLRVGHDRLGQGIGVRAG